MGSKLAHRAMHKYCIRGAWLRAKETEIGTCLWAMCLLWN